MPRAMNGSQPSSRLRRNGRAMDLGVDDLDALAGDAGLTVVNDVKMAELFGTFWPNRQLDSKWYDNYAVCTPPRRNSSAIPAYTVSSIRRKALSRLDRSPDKGVLRLRLVMLLIRGDGIRGSRYNPRKGHQPLSRTSGIGCLECLAEGGWWFHLRRCAECGHIGCCDSSPNQRIQT